MPKKKQPGPEDFSPEEMAQVQRHGKALLGEPTDFDEAVEEHLADHYPHEASAKKMRAAQTGGGTTGLGPSDMDQAAIKQRGAIQQQATTEGAQTAAQAQAQQMPQNTPPAPAGPQGSTIPFSTQRGAVGGPGNTQAQPPGPPPPAPGGPAQGPPPEEGEEEGPPQ